MVAYAIANVPPFGQRRLNAPILNAMKPPVKPADDLNLRVRDF
jgi:hypothetical protein